MKILGLHLRDAKGSRFKQTIIAWYICLALIVLVSGLLIMYVTSRYTREKNLESLLADARLYVETFDLNRVRFIIESNETKGAAIYQRRKQQVSVIRQTDPLLRTIYLVELRSDIQGPDQVKIFPLTNNSPSWLHQTKELVNSNLIALLNGSKPMIHGPVNNCGEKQFRLIIPLSNQNFFKNQVYIGFDFLCSSLDRKMIDSVWPTFAATILLMLVFSFLIVQRIRGKPVTLLKVFSMEQSAIIIVCLILTVYAVYLSNDIESHHRAESFRSLAESKTGNLARAMYNIRDFELEGLAKFCEGTECVEQTDFEKYALHLTLDTRVSAWEWIPVVPLNVKLGQKRQQGQKGLNLSRLWEKNKSGRSIPVLPRPFYYPVYFVTPLKGNERALGYDLGSESLRKKALDESMSTCLSSGTEPIILVQERGKQKGMLVCKPVYYPKKKDSLRGFALAVLRLGNLMQSAGPDMNVSIELLQLPFDNHIYTSCSSLLRWEIKAGRLTFSRPIFAFGKIFLIKAYSGDEFDRTHPHHAGWYAGLAGVFLTISFMVLIFSGRKREEKLESLVSQRTEALWVSNELNKSLINTIPFEMNIIDETGSLLFLNENLRKRYGEEALGKKCWILYRADGNHCNSCPQLSGVAIGKTEISETHGLFGDRTYQISHTGMMYQGKKAILEIFQDVTDQRKTEEELLQAKDKAEESSRLKSAFLANMSHEVRTPMNAIMGFAGLLDEVDNEEERKSFIRIIQNSSSQLVQVIDDVLYLSRLQTETTRLKNIRFKPSLLIRDVFQMFHFPELTRGSELNVNIPEKLNDLVVNADSSKISQVLCNLVSNALKYTDHGSVEIGFGAKELTLVFYVKDTGMGIPDHEQHKVFDSFYRGEQAIKRAISGTGLGLKISKELVGILGGKIDIVSMVGRGSNFTFTVPVDAMYYETLEPVAATPVEKTNFGNLDVLIAEDDINNFNFIQYILKKIVRSTDHACNGTQAVEMALSRRYDIIFMDLKMPGMNGLEATRAIKKVHPQILIIAQTAYSQPEEKEAALREGCDDYLSKPISRRDLLTVISRHFQ